MGIKNKIADLANWCAEGSISQSIAKTFAVAAMATCAAVAPFGAVAAISKDHSYQNAFEAIDRSQSVSFRSTDACVTGGYDAALCQKGEKSARAYADALGTRVIYENKKDCAEIHGSDNCLPKTDLFPNVTIVSGKVFATPHYDVAYKPKVVAWQAPANDIQHAVPLYPTTQANMARRADGRIFALGSGS
ncbi:MAG: DUF1190 domain-containing protein [Alphaproteobacteria bacterium]|nr:DUF1190 domain-containing protein [Alphaproteobacteria bacterium]